MVVSFNFRHKNQNYIMLLCLCLENYWVFGATSKKMYRGVQQPQGVQDNEVYGRLLTCIYDVLVRTGKYSQCSDFPGTPCSFQYVVCKAEVASYVVLPLLVSG